MTSTDLTPSASVVPQGFSVPAAERLPLMAQEAMSAAQRDAADETAALDFTSELLRQHGSSDATYAEAVQTFGEQGVVELTSLVGYFVMVCRVMNVARTPTQAKAGFAPLTAFPA